MTSRRILGGLTLLGWFLLLYCAATLHARPCDGRRVATFCLHPNGTWTEYPSVPADVLGPSALVLASLPLIFSFVRLCARGGTQAARWWGRQAFASPRSVEDVDATSLGGGLFQCSDGSRIIEFQDGSEWLCTAGGWTSVATGGGNATIDASGVAIGTRKLDFRNGPSPEQFDALWTAVLAARGCKEPN